MHFATYINTLSSDSSETLVCISDENSNQSFMSDVYQPKVDGSSSSSSQHASDAVSPVSHTFTIRSEDPQPPMLGQERVDGRIQHSNTDYC